MTQYIDKAAVVAEIKRRIAFFSDINNKQVIDSNLDCAIAFAGLCDFLDTLDVKEVDLEKEMDKEWNKCEPVDEGMGLEIASIEHEQFDNIAKYFFELGIKAQKGEKI